MDEQSQVSRATRDLSIAFSNDIFARFFVRVSLSSAVERSSDPRGAELSSDIAHPSEADQVRAVMFVFLKIMEQFVFCCSSQINFLTKFLGFLAPAGSSFPKCSVVF